MDLYLAIIADYSKIFFVAILIILLSFRLLLSLLRSRVARYLSDYANYKVKSEALSSKCTDMDSTLKNLDEIYFSENGCDKNCENCRVPDVHAEARKLIIEGKLLEKDIKRMELDVKLITKTLESPFGTLIRFLGNIELISDSSKQRSPK